MLGKLTRFLIVSNLISSLILVTYGLTCVYFDLKDPGIINLRTAIFHWNLQTENAGLLIIAMGISWSLLTTQIVVSREKSLADLDRSPERSASNKVAYGLKIAFVLWIGLGIAAYMTNFALFSIAFFFGIIIFPIALLIYVSIVATES